LKEKTQERREEEEQIKIGSIPMLRLGPAEVVVENGTPTEPVLDTREKGHQQADTPYPERRDPVTNSPKHRGLDAKYRP
jgi:hypothetical protein